ncbi:MAG: c-type cytochrome [Gammaproteobacteria bacterium]
MLNVFKRILMVLAPAAILLAGAVYPFAASADDSAQAVQLAQLTEGLDVEAKYMASCFACHSTGAAGAPKVGAGNAEAWEPRLEKGMDAMMANVINGLNTMPPKGLCFDCTDDDLRAIVDWMVESSQQ